MRFPQNPLRYGKKLSVDCISYCNYIMHVPSATMPYAVGCGDKHSVFFRNVNSGIRHRQHLRCSALRQRKKMLQEQYLYIFPDARSLRNSLHCSADCNAHAREMSEYRALECCLLTAVNIFYSKKYYICGKRTNILALYEFRGSMRNQNRQPQCSRIF